MFVGARVSGEVICFLAPVGGVAVGAVARREEVGVSGICILVVGFGYGGTEPECRWECDEDLDRECWLKPNLKEIVGSFCAVGIFVQFLLSPDGQLIHCRLLVRFEEEDWGRKRFCFVSAILMVSLRRLRRRCT